MRSCADARRSAPVALATLVALAVAIAPSPAAGQATAGSLYSRAQALARALPRDGSPTAQALERYRRAVAAYELVVRRFPRSGYCDDALWRAADLSAQAAARFGRATDRTKTVELLGWLAKEYPRSPLAVQARSRIASTSAPAGAKPASPAAPSPPSAAPPRPLAPVARPASTLPQQAAVRSVRRTVLTDIVRVTVELDREVPFKATRLARPERVQVVFESSAPGAGLMLGTLSYRDAQVSRLQVDRPDSTRVRLLLDLDDSPRYSVFPLYDPFRLVIDVDRPSRPEVAVASRTRETLVAPDAPPPSRTIAAPAPAAGASRTAGTVELPPLPGRPIDAGLVVPITGVTEPLAAFEASPDASKPSSSSPPRQAAPPPVPPANSAPPPDLPTANAGGGFSMARQLGLGVSRVVIDPGHGGHDPGALGRGVTEAEIVLDVALRLEKLLSQQGIDVVLTRRGDESVALDQRTALANRARADLFISIHANASRNPQARGVETYFLNFASNPDAEAVAARENASSARTMAALSDIVRAIALNAKLDESRDLAAQVQRAMVRRLRAGQRGFRDLGVKQAPFVVLVGATMPSVLAEISFITHGQEGKLLRTAAYRQKVAEALLDGIRRYQTSLKTARANLEQ